MRSGPSRCSSTLVIVTGSQLLEVDHVAAELAVEHHHHRPRLAGDPADESVTNERQPVVGGGLPPDPVAEAEGHGRPATSATTASESSGHRRIASTAQSSNDRSVRATRAQPGHRIDPHHRAGTAEVTVRGRRVACGRSSAATFRPRISKPSPHGHGSKRPTPGTIPASSGYCGWMASAAVAAVDERRPLQLGEEASHVVHRGRRRRGPPSRQLGSRPSRAARGRPRAGTRRRASRLPPRPRRRPSRCRCWSRSAAARPGHRLGPVERVPAGVGEQVAQRAPGLADRIVEADDALLDGDQRGPRRRAAWSARPAGSGGRPRRRLPATRAVAGDDGRADGRHRPRRDQLEGPHHGVRRGAPEISSATRNARSRLWRALRRGSHIVS